MKPLKTKRMRCLELPLLCSFLQRRNSTQLCVELVVFSKKVVYISFSFRSYDCVRSSNRRDKKKEWKRLYLWGQYWRQVEKLSLEYHASLCNRVWTCYLCLAPHIVRCAFTTRPKPWELMTPNVFLSND